MPLLTEENPRMAENLSAMALRLRLDEQCLSRQADHSVLPAVQQLKAMDPAIRSRVLEQFLKRSGVREPEQSHIAAAEALVFSEKPSARANFPGGIVIGRVYDRLEKLEQETLPAEIPLPCPGEAVFGGYRIICRPAESVIRTPDVMTVQPQGCLTVGSRRSGDTIRLSGGTKSLKKLFIDRKIPAAQRQKIPVVCDDAGILGVYTIGSNWDRTAGENLVTIRFENTEN